MDEMALATQIIDSVFWGAALMLLGFLLGNLFIGLAVRRNALSRGIENCTAYWVLTAIFGFIPGIIYLAVRKNIPVTAEPKAGGKGTAWLVLGIIAHVAGFVLYLAVVAGSMVQIISYSM